LEQRADVHKDSGRRGEQAWSEDRFLSRIFFPENAQYDTKDSDDDGRQHPRALPRILDAAPRYSDQETGCSRREEKTTNPVHASELGRKRRLLGLEPDVDRDKNETDDAKGKLLAVNHSLTTQPESSGTHIDVETPRPVDVLNKEAANQWAKHATQRPGGEHDGEVLWPLSQRYNVGEDDLAHGDDPTATDALDGAANEEDGEVLCDGRAQRRAHGEEKNRGEEQLLAPKDVRQRGDEGLADCAREKIRRPGPEGVVGGPPQVYRECLPWG